MLLWTAGFVGCGFVVFLGEERIAGGYWATPETLALPPMRLILFWWAVSWGVEAQRSWLTASKFWMFRL